MDESLITRFWSLVDDSTDDGCWLWLGGVRNSYGRLYIGGGQCMSAHRAAYEIGHGVEPGKLHVCHRCDVRTCVNPSHLFLGTTQDNTADRTEKGRSARGESSGTSKFTEAKMREMHARRLSGETVIALSRELGVGRNLLRVFFSGQTWKHLNLPPIKLPQYDRGGDKNPKWRGGISKPYRRAHAK